MDSATTTDFGNGSWTTNMTATQHSPSLASPSPYHAASPDDRPRAHPPQQPQALRRRSPPTATSPILYKFIVQTGDESSTTAKLKLKTVRSHVMKNYLHQQHCRQDTDSGDPLMVASSDRRRSKLRARSNCSESRDTDSSTSPTMSSAGRARSGSIETKSMFAGFTPISRTSVAYAPQSESGHDQRFALDFGFFGQADEVSIHAQAYAVSMTQDRKAGLLQPSFQTLKAKGETMRTVQYAIAGCGNNVHASIIYCVCLLALACGEDQEWDEARGHLEATQRLLNTRGGIHTVDFELQRAITWVSYTLSAALRLPPCYPLPLFFDFRPFTLAFQDDAQIRAWRTVKRFPKNAAFVFDIVVRLHQLSQATSLDWDNEIDQRTLSNLYFETLHSTNLLQIDEPWNSISGGGIKEAATMFQVWAAGLPLFIWGTFRHVRAQRAMNCPICHRYDPVLVRIRALLGGAAGHHAWPQGKNLEPVLATLFYGIEACSYGAPGWRAWCMETLRIVARMLKLKKVEDFSKTLECFPLTEVYRSGIDGIWNEMMHGSVPSTNSKAVYDSMSGDWGGQSSNTR